MRFWTNNFDFWRTVASRVTVNVNKGLNDAGITIPFPQRDLHVKSIAESARDAVRADKPPAPPGAAEGGS